MNFKDFLSFIFLTVIALMLWSCAGVPRLDSSIKADEAVKIVAENTPDLCGYKGRIAVKAIDGVSHMSFNALLDKSCSGNLSAVFLGPLNSVVAKMIYTDNHIQVESDYTDVKEHILLMGRVYGDISDKYLKSPLFLPDKSYDFSIGKDSYIFEKDGYKIYADSLFRLYRYEFGDFKAFYKWDGLIISEADISDSTGRVVIKFLNDLGWHGLSTEAGR